MTNESPMRFLIVTLLIATSAVTATMLLKRHVNAPPKTHFIISFQSENESIDPLSCCNQVFYGRRFVIWFRQVVMVIQWNGMEHTDNFFVYGHRKAQAIMTTTMAGCIR